MVRLPVDQNVSNRQGGGLYINNAAIMSKKIIHLEDLPTLLEGRDDLMLHPVRVTVRTGNDDFHTQEAVITDSKGLEVVLKDVSAAKENWGNRPREMDVMVEYSGEEGEQRTLQLCFHKGRVLLTYESGGTE